MALIKCPECSHEISNKATSCPQCGYPLRNLDDLLHKVLTATVRIESQMDNGKSIGTGFIVGNGNFAATALHVVNGAKEVKAIRYNPPRESRLREPEEIIVDSWTKGTHLIGIKKDATKPAHTNGGILTELPNRGAEALWSLDISILHLKSQFSNTLPLDFDTDFARIGEEVLFVGYPNGGVEFETEHDKCHPAPLTSKAIVAFATRYGMPPVEEYYYWLDHPSFSGNSGGPVIRLKTGKVVGIISATPFMPKKIYTESGHIEVFIPDGYSIAFVTVMLTEFIEAATKSESWKNGLQ